MRVPLECQLETPAHWPAQTFHTRRGPRSAVTPSASSSQHRFHWEVPSPSTKATHSTLVLLMDSRAHHTLWHRQDSWEGGDLSIHTAGLGLVLAGTWTHGATSRLIPTQRRGVPSSSRFVPALQASGDPDGQQLRTNLGAPQNQESVGQGAQGGAGVWSLPQR